MPKISALPPLPGPITGAETVVANQGEGEDAVTGTAPLGALVDAAVAPAVAQAESAAASVVTPRQADRPVLAQAALPLATSAGAQLQADGSFTYDNGFSVRWDYPLTAEEIAAGKVTLLLQGSAPFGSATVQQLGAGMGETVATAEIAVIGDDRYQTIDLEAATRFLRVAASRGAGTEGSFRPLCVGAGQLARAKTDPKLIAQEIRNMLDDEVIDLAAKPHFIEVFGFGAQGTINADGSFTVPANAQNRIYLSPIPGEGIIDGDPWMLALELVGGSGAMLAHVAVGKADGTFEAELQVNKRQDRFFFVTQAALDYDGEAASAFRIRIDTQNVAESPTGAQTFRARLFKAQTIPGFFSVPPLLAQDVQRQLADPASYGPVLLDGAAEGGGSPATGISVRVDADSFKLHQAMDARIMLLTSTKMHAVNTGGSNAAAGGLETPWATVAYAVANTANGDIIGLRNGQRHLVGDVGFTPSTPFQRSIIGYGPAMTRAIVDARQTISAGWTATPGRAGVYQVDVVLREPTETAGPSPSGKTAFGLWNEDDLFATWIVMNPTLAANLDEMEGTPGSFTVVRTGTINKDPRVDMAATTYTFFYHPLDGASPNGKAIRIADRSLVLSIEGAQQVRDVELIGANGKDFAQVRVDGLVGNYIARFCNQHGIVCQGNQSGDYKAYGRPVPGGIGFAEGRADGGGFHTFTPIDYPALDREYGRIHVENFLQGFYGHGAQGGQYYRNQTVERLTGRNLASAVAIDNRVNPGTGAAIEPLALAGTLRVREIDVSEIGTLCNTACHTVLGSEGRRSRAVFSDLAADANQMLAYLKALGQVVELIDIDIDFLKPLGPASKNYIARCLLGAGTGGADVPTLILNGLRYVGLMSNRPLLWFSADVSNRFHLELKRGTQWVDMHESAGADFYPASLTVRAGCTFGFGGRTRQQIRDWLDSHSVPHDISNATTIIGPRGNIIDGPA